MNRPRGALVARVLPNSPASKADLQVGDVILKYNGTELHSSSDLPPLVGRSNVDRPAQLDILRRGRMIKVPVKIGELPADEAMELAHSASPRIEKNRLGLVVSQLSDKLRDKLELPPGKGVIVESISGSAAREAGIQQEDVIMMLNNKDVESVEQFNSLVKELPAEKTVAILVHRNTGPIFLALRIPAE